MAVASACPDLAPASAHDLMLASLTLIGEADIDVVPLFFARFYAHYPAERDRFCNRASSEGLMVNEMLSMLLAQASQEPWLQTMMRAQVNTHHDHGDIALEQYQGAFADLLAVLAEACGPFWTAEHDRAWREQAAALFAFIARCY